MLDLAEMTAISALQRTESRGGHYREDFNQRDDEKWLVHSTIAPTAATVGVGVKNPEYVLHHDKKVDMSLYEAGDEHFKPKPRTY